MPENTRKSKGTILLLEDPKASVELESPGDPSAPDSRKYYFSKAKIEVLPSKPNQVNQFKTENK